MSWTRELVMVTSARPMHEYLGSIAFYGNYAEK